MHLSRLIPQKVTEPENNVKQNCQVCFTGEKMHSQLSPLHAPKQGSILKTMRFSDWSCQNGDYRLQLPLGKICLQCMEYKIEMYKGT